MDPVHLALEKNSRLFVPSDQAYKRVTDHLITDEPQRWF